MNPMEKIKIETASSEQRLQIKKNCIDNAKWLVEQAHAQFKLGNYSLTTFLAITAYEESLKFGLFSSLEGGLITEKKFNQIWSSHKFKLLSKHATIRVKMSDSDEVTQEYHLPEDSESLTQEAREILDKRENSLYVGLIDAKLSNPRTTNPADAIEEIHRAEASVRSELSLDSLLGQLKKHFKEAENSRKK
jgi:AbiV family abortive infection protein